MHIEIALHVGLAGVLSIVGLCSTGYIPLSMTPPAASTVAAPPAPMISRCITVAHSFNGGTTWELICLNPCLSGCENVDDGFPGQSDGKSCACVGDLPHQCCHVVLFAGGPLPTPGGCDDVSQCSVLKHCTMTVVVDGDDWEAWAECEGTT